MKTPKRIDFVQISFIVNAQKERIQKYFMLTNCGHSSKFIHKDLNKKRKLKVGNKKKRKKEGCSQEIGKNSQIPEKQGIRA